MDKEKIIIEEWKLIKDIEPIDIFNSCLILGIIPNNYEELNKWYKKIALFFHIDHNKSENKSVNKKINQILQKINGANTYLKDSFSKIHVNDEFIKKLNEINIKRNIFNTIEYKIYKPEIINYLLKLRYNTLHNYDFSYRHINIDKKRDNYHLIFNELFRYKDFKDVCHSLILTELNNFPEEIKNLPNLDHLELSYNKFSEFPKEIGNLTKLNHLDLSHNKFSELPKEIGNLTKLNHLDLSYNKFSELPKEIGNLTSLNHLDLSYNKFSELPKEIGNLTNLEELRLYKNNLSKLPEEIGNLENLKYLDLSYNVIQYLPDEIGNLTNLKKLNLSSNIIQYVPKKIGNLTNLEDLILEYNEILSLSEEIGNLNMLKYLDLSYNNFNELPEEIGNLTNLNRLNLSYNKNLLYLPDSLSNLKNVKIILNYKDDYTPKSKIIISTKLFKIIQNKIESNLIIYDYPETHWRHKKIFIHFFKVFEVVDDILYQNIMNKKSVKPKTSIKSVFKKISNSFRQITNNRYYNNNTNRINTIFHGETGGRKTKKRRKIARKTKRKNKKVRKII